MLVWVTNLLTASVDSSKLLKERVATLADAQKVVRPLLIHPVHHLLGAQGLDLTHFHVLKDAGLHLVPVVFVVLIVLQPPLLTLLLEI